MPLGSKRAVETMHTVKIARQAMACTFEITISASEKDYLRDVATEAADLVAYYATELNCFDPKSEISYINGNAYESPVTAGPELFEVLSLAKEVWKATDGIFDVTSGPIVDLWRKAEESGSRPDSKEIGDIKDCVGMDKVILDPSTNKVKLQDPRTRINLGGIGKGYAAGKVVELLRDYNIDSALVNAGNSSVCALGLQPDGKPWKVGIRHPKDFDRTIETIELDDMSLGVSGGREMADREIEEHFEHIVCPATGDEAKSEVVCAAVNGKDAGLCDALATSLYIGGRNISDKLKQIFTGISVTIVEKQQIEDNRDYRLVHL